LLKLGKAASKTNVAPELKAGWKPVKKRFMWGPKIRGDAGGGRCLLRQRV